MDVHMWKRFSGLLKARGIAKIKEVTFILEYGATAARSKDKIWTTELMSQSSHSLTRKTPGDSVAEHVTDEQALRNLVCEYVTRRSTTSQSPSATTPSLDHGSNNIYGSITNASTDISLGGLNMDYHFDYAPFSTAHMNNTEPIQNITIQTTPQDWLLQRWDPVLPTPAAPSPIPTAVMTPTVSLDYREPSKEINMTVEEISSALPADKVIKMLRSYPVSLASDGYHTSLLHRELYNVSTSDITALPRSSTAITCALSLENTRNVSFLKRATIAERQRLVEAFSACIDEWDALHAMWLYEMMELPDIEDDAMNNWKPGSRTKGLNLPIVLKMTRRFCQSHPEATDPSAEMNRDSRVRYVSAPSAWMTWLVAETARRTIFLAHIVNYYATKDPKTGEVSPYYESLNDEMIWNMPLPCSSAAWKARTEQEWLDVLRKEHKVMATEGQYTLLSEIFSNEPTISSLLAKFTKDQLRLHFSGEMGLDESDSLRNLIIHCALEQSP
ncbi:unnamed protein product [Aureobasidium mustum]|uniref:Uncharacterized protein n=1 Tax=Aureobasidium mustum TaxID=2773714 RepID=A0A9N8PHS6_9PEZI|nr:unnamed protein product [Aureobasidium mustum]